MNSTRGAIRFLAVVSGATVGGAETQLLYVLERLDRTRFEPTVLTVLDEGSPQRRGGPPIGPRLERLEIPHQRIDAMRFPEPRALWELRRRLFKYPWDLVQTWGLRVDLAVRLLMGPGPSPKLLASIRGLERQRSASLFRLDGWTSRRVQRYIANTHAGKREFSKRAHVDPTRISVVYNGIDTGAFASTVRPDHRDRIRNDLQVSPSDVLVGVVANLHGAKGHEDLLHATAALDESNRSPVLVLVGTDRTNGRIERLATQLGIGHRTRILGTRTDVPSILAACDLACLPSHHEGMPNALMEAMAMTLPVVATAVGGIPELVLDEETGLLVPPHAPDRLAGALARLADDPELRSRFGRAGHARIKDRFSVERMVEDTTALYEEAIARAEVSSG